MGRVGPPASEDLYDELGSLLYQPVARVAELPDRVAIRPRTDAAARRGAQLVLRVDAPGEDLLEARVHRRPSEALLDYGVHAEARQMALVEHDRVAQGDWAREVAALRQHVEELGGTRPVAAIPLEDRLAIEGAGGLEGRV